MSAKIIHYCCFVNINRRNIITIPKLDCPPSITTHFDTSKCGATFSSVDDLRGHRETEHQCEAIKTDYKCGVCETIYDTQQTCLKHYEECHIGMKQNHVYIEPDDEPIAIGESNVEQNQIIIKVINPSDIERNKLDPSHIEPSYVEIKNVEPNYADDPHELLEYGAQMYTQTDLINKFTQKVTLDGKVKFLCDICDKKYSSKALLHYHMYIHTGERPYKCTLCTKSFTNPLFLKLHIRTHTGERPYQCSVCPKAFTSKAALWRHDKVHTGEKPYECVECLKSFTQSNSLKLHLNTVHLKKPTPYKYKSRRARKY